MEVDNGGNNKVRVTLYRDFPPGCGCGSSKLPFFIPGKKSVHNYTREFPPGCGPDAPKTTQFDGDSFTWRRGVGAVRSKPLTGDREGTRTFQNLEGNRKGKHLVLSSEGRPKERENVFDLKKDQKLKGKEPVLGNEGRSKERESVIDLKKDQKLKEIKTVPKMKNSGEGEKVVEMLRLFRERCNEISRSGKGVRRVDTTAYGELKNEGKIRNMSALRFGDVPGVEIGDKFHYRIELMIVGLHKQPQSGIDSMEWGKGRVATSIVANERHLDKMNNLNSLIYIGEGGNLKRHEVGVPPDQELKSGNLALWTSMKENKPVRVIRGLVYKKNVGQNLYVYDGLYEVKECEKKKGPLGNMIFEFQLVRCDGQPAVNWQECRRYRF
ncbi:histone-lysine N-methyltransferase, H3 lysine-9 specific SUVH6-like [Spinacia oleracea]|uniref:Histone-lysine N-methyltransferase, H3 lysine-9 specific SUVH6-like n=1 Tax=Spinacia oleracea TaxID=3562 RepID=A0ABM3R168_SPIOL|nr:histone-lysine N-methyltransferase, H3 lysine-9 specific SUVH6-like [Spinacia oleracea]XP_056689304.1 histone-lysine N-methyltransferase, H3 lysine-9 specific SUVH6-like [Spinacia oleracea]XP_056689305.1 histone-lysine N-methyltransferase, H3 lysine-9 specific SUVH6-like [Spinacia oleracea]XP_056689306.1 histone-lysine N-methyltransferase, H3 lysine-9 specific SUVH6-like [Spinacia oleracea]XP_056689307.1 histone-lysine N-methyltransferase, H3 lysine-9 specific SUVH6-like [Spinacia oleracea]